MMPTTANPKTSKKTYAAVAAAAAAVAAAAAPTDASTQRAARALKYSSIVDIRRVTALATGNDRVKIEEAARAARK